MKTNATTYPEVLGVQVSRCIYNTVIPLLIGTRRIAGNVIWYGAFGNGPSNKKGKSVKKGGPPDYQANIDVLLAYGPIWSIQAAWQNSQSSGGYGTGPGQSPFCQMGNQTYAVTSGDYTLNADGTYTYSNTVNNQPSGYNLDFLTSISFTPTTPVSSVVDDYGDPSSPRTLTESLTEQWLYNTYDNYASSGAAAVAWRPGCWNLGKPLCNEGHCSFPIGVDHGDAGWSITLPAPTAGTITVYYGCTKANHDTPLSFMNYEFEPELGSGNEYASSPGQQILYPELSGIGAVALDLGASGTAPQQDVEAQGMYALTKTGGANPADAILTIILSGNTYFPDGAGGFTPLCSSHGLNFGGDPTRVNWNGFSGVGAAGTLAWPPTTVFPYVLPGANSAGSAATLGGQFQILKDTPQFHYGSWVSGTYPAGAIVSFGSLNTLYIANVSATDAPNSGSGTWSLFTGELSDGLMDIRNYCTANGIFASMILSAQRDAADVLGELCQVANCVPVWNGQTLDFYPYSEVSQVGGGAVFTPRTASGPLAAFDYRHFQTDANQAPVIVRQEGMQAVYNILDVNYADRGDGGNGACGYQAYQSSSVRICDAEHCQLFGPMNGSPLGFDDYITDANTATLVGWPIMNRQRFADTYHVEFRLPATLASLLDPMDLITVMEPSLFGGVQQNGVKTTGPGQLDCRIVELEEDESGTWTLTCERFMYGMSSPLAPNITSAVPNAPPQANIPAGSVNTPYIFEPTAAVASALGMNAAGGLVIAVSNSSANYGGCQVYVSTDGGSSYQQLGAMGANSIMGSVYSADYPSSPNPDTTDTLHVDLTESNGSLVSWTSAQQTQLNSIALLDNGGTGSAGGYTLTIPYEIVAYQGVTLSAAHKYALAPTILRAQLGTVPAVHVIGKTFVDLTNPNSVFKTSIPSGAIVGNTLHFKFPSFNLYGSAIQDLADCTAYSYAVTGATNPNSGSGGTGNTSYTLAPASVLYQGKSGGWPGVGTSSTGWTDATKVYWPSFVANFSTGAVTYAENDTGIVAFSGSGQTSYISIFDPTHSGSGTAHADSTNTNSTSPGFVFLGKIISSAPGSAGSSGGSSSPGGPQDISKQTFLTVKGVPVPTPDFEEGTDISLTVSGSTITIAATGGGSAGTGNLFSMPNLAAITQSTGWNNYSFFVKLGARQLNFLPTSWHIGFITAPGATTALTGIKVLKTAKDSLTVLSSTAVTVASSASPTLAAGSFIQSDAISLTLDNAHDYWCVLHISNTSLNTEVYGWTAGQGSGMLTAPAAGFLSGDQTGVTTIPAGSLGSQVGVFDQFYSS